MKAVWAGKHGFLAPSLFDDATDRIRAKHYSNHIKTQQHTHELSQGDNSPGSPTATSHPYPPIAARSVAKLRLVPWF